MYVSRADFLNGVDAALGVDVGDKVDEATLKATNERLKAFALDHINSVVEGFAKDTESVLSQVVMDEPFLTDRYEYDADVAASTLLRLFGFYYRPKHTVYRHVKNRIKRAKKVTLEAPIQYRLAHPSVLTQNVYWVSQRAQLKVPITLTKETRDDLLTLLGHRSAESEATEFLRLHRTNPDELRLYASQFRDSTCKDVINVSKRMAKAAGLIAA